MRVVETAVYRGPNLRGSQPMVRLRIDLGALEEWPSDRIPGFVERLTELLPGLASHGCSLGRPGGFLERLRDGTWLGHVVEHAAIELQCIVGSRVTRGKTRGVPRSPGVYDALYAYEDAEVALAAGAVAVRLVSSLLPEPLCLFDCGRLRMPEQTADDGPIPGMAALRALAARRRLGPTTASLVEAARRRGIPVHVPGDGSLVRLGYGANQRRIRASITMRRPISRSSLRVTSSARAACCSRPGFPCRPVRSSRASRRRSRSQSVSAVPSCSSRSTATTGAASRSASAVPRRSREALSSRDGTAPASSSSSSSWAATTARSWSTGSS